MSISDDTLATMLRKSIAVQNGLRSKDFSHKLYSSTHAPSLPTNTATTVDAVGPTNLNKKESCTAITTVELEELMRRSITVQRRLKSRHALCLNTPMTDVTSPLPTLSLESTIIAGNHDTSCSAAPVDLLSGINANIQSTLETEIECTLDIETEGTLDMGINMDYCDVDQMETVLQNKNIRRKRVLCEPLEDCSISKKKKQTYDDLKFNALQYETCHAVLDYVCPCASRNGSTCLKSFKTVGEVLNARIEHYNRSPREEYQLRTHEVREAIKFQKRNEKAYVAVSLLHGQKYKVCLNSYAVLYGLPATSFWRTVGQIRHHNSIPARIGRPHRSNETTDPIVSIAAEECIEWIRNWVVLLSDESPTGDDWDKAIDPIDTKEVYEEYDVWFKAFHFTLTAKPLSFSTFTIIWNHWLKVDRIKVRNKSQTTTKCSICEDLRCRARSIGVTTKELNTIKAERKKHREDIRALRERYQADVQRASHDPSFATIIFDGTDSSYCICPQTWRGMVRMEQASDSCVEQKIQSVLIHGVALCFYVAVPFVPKGMDLTVSVLLDALLLLPPEVQFVRFQFDGLL